jgi:hypothetical protein
MAERGRAMRLCMFHPVEQPMPRGWVGRIDGEHVIQLAAQTLQSFFTGGGTAREHAVYQLGGVKLLAPVLHPPAVRVFDDQSTFSFANPAAIVGPGAEIRGAHTPPSDTVSQGGFALRPRLAAVIGAEGRLGGLAIFAEWRRAELAPPKDRDFALGLGPVVVTTDELDPGVLDAVVRVDGREVARGAFTDFDWDAARDLAAGGTTLYPGDLLSGPALEQVAVDEPARVEIDVAGLGVLDHAVVP